MSRTADVRKAVADRRGERTSKDVSQSRRSIHSRQAWSSGRITFQGSS
jgi:hypothetical protein